MNFKTSKYSKGFTFIEIVIVLVLLSLIFLTFFYALNTGTSVRVHSELRTIQGTLLIIFSIRYVQDILKIRPLDHLILEKKQTKERVRLISLMILMISMVIVWNLSISIQLLDIQLL